ncbi:MAG: FAD-dependent oxidoreductase [Burkholderiales bacterium]|nr:FAD-dependent oxidoreductase [Burkholderiales bacterium]
MHLHELPAQGAGLDFEAIRFDYRHSADQDRATPARHPIVVVGGGPIGLSQAIDLAQRGLPVVVLERGDRLSTGSRALCFSKRTLEIFDRLGCCQPMVDKGVSWHTGRVFFGNDEVYQFDLLPEEGHERPAFINLQQYYVEGQLAVRAAQLPNIDLRWHNKVVGLQQHDDHVALDIDTPQGRYTLHADYVIACDGARSTLRELLGQESRGQVFRDRFLIADVRMQAEFPAERWFWFEPPFHRGGSVLLHRQADSVWRIDFQLGWDADPEKEKQPENIRPRVQALLGADAQFELVWASVYTFACLRMDSFRHGRVLFAGDAAHGVSPFGARGANSGVQDIDNLGWKLAAVLGGQAPESLLDSYAREREYAADENILNSTRSTDFITPKSPISRMFRDAVLRLAGEHRFARTLVNSGRLSVPAVLHGSVLSTPDRDEFAGSVVPGACAADAPLQLEDGSTQWLLRRLSGNGFAALVFGDAQAAAGSLRAIETSGAALDVLRIGESAANQLAWQRYDARPGTVYLLRPDQHVCARWRAPTAADISAALQRAMGGAAGQVLDQPLGTQASAHSTAQREAPGTSAQSAARVPAAQYLITTPNLDAPDDFYEALIDTHALLDNGASHALNARLVLLLANHIGSSQVLREALAQALRGATPGKA